ncbi:ABC transporter permease [Solibacillus sp. FSL K6-1523]|uniref:ABC transporter permease n=1 Tax=Solibacillus sp. FSL K6-1523 TaxID=2921471 RepID=UPI0030FB401E
MISFFTENASELLFKTWEHLYISFIALLFGTLIAVPLGVLLSKTKKVTKIVLTITSMLQTVPSLALLAIMIPFLGIGKVPAIVALCIYSLLPILNNTFTGMQSVNESVKAAGKAMGMTPAQSLRMIELPLAMPVIMSGIRLSAVYVISWATLASYIGAGGLGDYIFNGLNLFKIDLIVGGAIVVTLLALVIDFILSRIERNMIPKGLRIQGGRSS